MGEPVGGTPPVRASRWLPAEGLPAYPQAPAPSSGANPAIVNAKPNATDSSPLVAKPLGPKPLGQSNVPSSQFGASPIVSSSTRRAGQLIGGRYRLVDPLAHGAETEAWSAEHVELGRPVVIKFVHSDSSGVSDRLLQQARVLAKIRHPHVAEFSDFGRTDAGEPYFVMEQLRGRTLQQLLDQRGGMAWARAVAIIQQVGEALAAGHAQGVVHRDLRPANVFLIETGQPGDFAKLVDFGLASDPDPRRLSPMSAGFASPEQASGSLLDPRSDVYALGCLLYALIAGDPPFVGTTEQVLWAQIHSPAKSLRERAPKQYIPDELQGILTRCLDKLPARRFTDTRELASALAQFARLAAAASHSGSPVPAPEVQASRSQVMGFAGRAAPKDAEELDRSLRPITRSAPVVASKRTSPLVVVGVVVLVALLVGGAGIGVYTLVQSLIARDEPVEKAESAEPSPPAPAPSPAPSTPTPEQALVEPPPPLQPEPAPTPALADAEAPDASAPSKASSRRVSSESKPAIEGTPAPAPPEPEPVPIKPTTKPESKANDNISHGDLVDPWG